jgi:hypothetical protein
MLVQIIHNPYDTDKLRFFSPSLTSQQNTDEFTTPQPRRSRSLSNREFLSKNELIDLLRVIDFHGFYLPPNAASDNIDDTPSFLKAVCDDLVTVLLTHALKQASPKKLLNSSPPFISPTADSSVGDSGSPRIKLYSAKGRPPSLTPSSIVWQLNLLTHSVSKLVMRFIRSASPSETS